MVELPVRWAQKFRDDRRQPLLILDELNFPADDYHAVSLLLSMIKTRAERLEYMQLC